MNGAPIPMANVARELRDLHADDRTPDPVETAREFESLLVQQMISGMRETASVLGEGGMFGDGPGSDTYAEWFDTKLANNVTSNAGIGVVDVVLADIARWEKSGMKFSESPPTPQR